MSRQFDREQTAEHASVRNILPMLQSVGLIKFCFVYSGTSYFYHNAPDSLCKLVVGKKQVPFSMAIGNTGTWENETGLKTDEEGNIRTL